MQTKSWRNVLQTMKSYGSKELKPQVHGLKPGRTFSFCSFSSSPFYCNYKKN
ncbi:hypothetical protein Hdeb2414_s0002g00050181 [Helianthus debilis subsp. tardiflorus]